MSLWCWRRWVTRCTWKGIKYWMLHAWTLGILLISSQSSCGQTRFLSKRMLVGGSGCQSHLGAMQEPSLCWWKLLKKRPHHAAVWLFVNFPKAEMVAFKSVSLSYGLCFPDWEVLVLSLVVTMGAVVLIQCKWRRCKNQGRKLLMISLWFQIGELKCMLMLFINTVLTLHTSFVSNHRMERKAGRKSARTGVALVSDGRASCLGVEWCLTWAPRTTPGSVLTTRPCSMDQFGLAAAAWHVGLSS